MHAAHNIAKGGDWQPRQQLIDQLMQSIRTYNAEGAKPFNWTYAGEAA